MKNLILLSSVLLIVLNINAQDIRNNPESNHGNRFEQLGTILPSPNEYRTASGAPGNMYWQQRCDYDITCELDEDKKILYGKETITYTNNSPDILNYLWLQLDENEHSAVNNSGYPTESTMPQSLTPADINKLKGKQDRDYGVNITKLTNSAGQDLSYTINKTMMRVDLPLALKPGQQYVLKIDWNYNIIERTKYGGRGGFEHFNEDGNDLFTITQWFPRLCVYSDFQGWQNHQFTGRGEFALVFGNYKVSITVPADHIVMGTGECKNYEQVLTPTQLGRWQKAQNAKDVVEIVTLAEAKENEKKRSKLKKTWIFKADMVRDFAWGSSRKFIWDAMPEYVEGKKVMCMSAYGKEAYSLYRKFSTKVVAHTIKSYSKLTIPYPYPVAQSIEAANGMEYPMICFNFGRTEKDGTYSEATKNGMIGVVIHEVGHNFFPMIVNSDERQWSWLDEGLNTFCQYITELLWDENYPASRGPAYKIVDYMKLPKDKLEPIMTNSENIIQFGPNAYAKPATALNILRETIIGRNLFDFAFREYSRRWAFKHPTPADFFRTMEDATAVDLDWFWRGWFFNTEPCDISIDSVKWAVLSDSEPVKIKTEFRNAPVVKPLLDSFTDISKIRNKADKNIVTKTSTDTSLQDFYWRYGRGLASVDTTSFKVELTPPEVLTGLERTQTAGNLNLYEVSFSNKGGLVMPIIIEWTFNDGTRDTTRLQAEIWRKNEKNVTKVFAFDKEVSSIKLDPLKETADIDESNNNWPKISTPSKFQLYKSMRKSIGNGNSMQREIK